MVAVRANPIEFQLGVCFDERIMRSNLKFASSQFRIYGRVGNDPRGQITHLNGSISPVGHFDFDSPPVLVKDYFSRRRWYDSPWHVRASVLRFVTFRKRFG